MRNDTSIVFYDVTTLYCEAEEEDELRKTGFSKDGKHQHPQVKTFAPTGIGLSAITYYFLNKFSLASLFIAAFLYLEGGFNSCC